MERCGILPQPKTQRPDIRIQRHHHNRPRPKRTPVIPPNLIPIMPQSLHVNQTPSVPIPSHIGLEIGTGGTDADKDVTAFALVKFDGPAVDARFGGEVCGGEDGAPYLCGALVGSDGGGLLLLQSADNGGGEAMEMESAH